MKFVSIIVLVLGLLTVGCIPERQNHSPSQGGFNPKSKAVWMTTRATPTSAPLLPPSLAQIEMYPEIETTRAIVLGTIWHDGGGFDVSLD